MIMGKNGIKSGGLLTTERKECPVEKSKVERWRCDRR
jgi:hypothetical protein